MSFTIEVKKKGFFKNKFTITDLLSEGLSYGAVDDDYRLNEGEVGEDTLIFATKEIGRGILVTINNKEVIVNVQEPSTTLDIKTLIQVLEKTLSLAKNDKFLYIDGEEEVELENSNLANLEQMLLDNQAQILESINQNPDIVKLKIFAAYHPVTIDKEEISNLEDFGKVLHQLQKEDIYYAAPTLFGNQEENFGCFTLTTDVHSVLPFQAKSSILLTDIEFNEWYLNFFDYESKDVLGTILYKDFLENVDTSKKFDEERFHIELNKEQMEELLAKFKVDLF